MCATFSFSQVFAWGSVDEGGSVFPLNQEYTWHAPHWSLDYHSFLLNDLAQKDSLHRKAEGVDVKNTIKVSL
jgi:hypothetical protein